MCIGKLLEFCVWMVKRSRIQDFYVQKDLLNIVFLYVKDDLVDMFLQVCVSGSLNNAKYLFSLGLTVEDVKAQKNVVFRWTCEQGQLEMSKWLFSLGLTLEDVKSEK